ncbi:MAG TPA: hypothetical protein VKW08_01180 [Xanthobacteraceae bacterium]|nr:hypothetical protein [Xanthobacteraceae bacterium]
MPTDAAWDCYLSARRSALRAIATAETVAPAIDRAQARLQAYLSIDGEQALHHARRSYFYTADAAFHDQLLASGQIDVLRAAVGGVAADAPLAQASRRGTLVVSLHYGPATGILPLWLAAASRNGLLPEVGVIENSRRDPNIMLTAQRHAELARCGFPLTDIDLAKLGELSAMRCALDILRRGGVVLIFADGQLPHADAKRTLTCRLGCRSFILPRGAEWLARTADVPLFPLLLRPEGDSSRIEQLPAFAPADARNSVQALLDAAMGTDPAPWWRWCSSAEHF